MAFKHIGDGINQRKARHQQQNAGGHRNGGCIAESGELQKQSGNGGGGESGKAKVDLWMKMTLCQQLADIHRGRTGKEGDDGTIPATVIEFTETGARKANH
ncbi:hypothetical protein ECZU08_21660 [Escherichia coli]|nr:hypothetical protein MUTS16_19660 [Escherichia coli]GHK46570.1 hypothetical protein ECZU08_21660 [Escherichia coli]